jgi:hypothetical protein
MYICISDKLKTLRVLEFWVMHSFRAHINSTFLLENRVRGSAICNEFHNSYSSRSIIRVIKSKRVIWVGLAACMGKIVNAYNIP